MGELPPAARRETATDRQGVLVMVLLNGLAWKRSPNRVDRNWEYQLKQMNVPSARALACRRFVRAGLVRRARPTNTTPSPATFGVLHALPEMRRRSARELQKFQVSNPACQFGLWKIISGRQFEPRKSSS